MSKDTFCRFLTSRISNIHSDIEYVLYYLTSLTLAKPRHTIHAYHTSFQLMHVCAFKNDRSLVSAPSVSASPGSLLATSNELRFVSHFVMRWKSGNARDLDVSSWDLISWIGMSRSFFPLPKPTHGSEKPSVDKKRMTMTATSLSTVRTN